MPDNLEKIDFKKNLEIIPIKITLPHVKNTTLWNPIIKSVMMNEISNEGKNFLPKIAGT